MTSSTAAMTSGSPATLFRQRNNKLRPAVRIAGLALLLAAVSPAQELRHLGASRSGGGIYDPVRERVINFGAGGYLREWDGTTWRQVPGRSPWLRAGYVDPTTGQLRIVGPDNPFSSSGVSPMLVRTGNSWQSVPLTTGPASRDGAATAYDAARGEFVLFGGFEATGMADTWTFDGTSWTQRNPAAAPTARGWAGMTYDAARQRVVMYGGWDGAADLDETWEWDGSTWLQRTFAVQPPARSFLPMAYDSARQRTVMLAPGSTVYECWEYDGTSWTLAQPLPAGANWPGGLVYDEARGETLAIGSFGGTTTLQSTGDVWAWDGATWSPRAGLGSNLDVLPQACATLDPLGSGVLVFGGGIANSLSQAAASDELWRFENATWSLVSAGPMAARRGAKMWTQQGSAYVFGGVSFNGVPFQDTWRWDGTSWTQLAASGPAGGEGGALAYDPISDRAVYFDNTTWTFDGTNWQSVATTNQPSTRFEHAMAFDPVQGRIVLFGGLYLIPFGVDQRRDTWTFDGSSGNWQFVTNAFPGNATDGSLAFDARLQQLVYAASGFQQTELHRFDGSTWSALPADGAIGGSMPLQSNDPLAITDALGELLVFDLYGARELVLDPFEVESYGSGCGAREPVLAANSLPQPGNAAFALDVTNAENGGVVAIVGATVAVSVPVFGCTLLVAPDQATAVTIASPKGTTSYPLALPNVPALIGNDYYFQAATLTTSAPNGIAFSAGLRLQIGL